VIIMIGATVLSFATAGFAAALFPFVVGLLLVFVTYGRAGAWRRIAKRPHPVPHRAATLD
jgi:hypothetical protein